MQSPSASFEKKLSFSSSDVASSPTTADVLLNPSARLAPPSWRSDSGSLVSKDGAEGREEGAVGPDSETVPPFPGTQASYSDWDINNSIHPTSPNLTGTTFKDNMTGNRVSRPMPDIGRNDWPNRLFTTPPPAQLTSMDFPEQYQRAIWQQDIAIEQSLFQKPTTQPIPSARQQSGLFMENERILEDCRGNIPGYDALIRAELLRLQDVYGVLAEELQSTAKESRYRCKICGHPKDGKGQRRWDLSPHILTHANTPIKPWKCSCGSDYARSHDLKRHQKSHSHVNQTNTLGSTHHNEDFRSIEAGFSQVSGSHSSSVAFESNALQPPRHAPSPPATEVRRYPNRSNHGYSTAPYPKSKPLVSLPYAPLAPPATSVGQYAIPDPAQANALPIGHCFNQNHHVNTAGRHMPGPNPYYKPSANRTSEYPGGEKVDQVCPTGSMLSACTPSDMEACKLTRCEPKSYRANLLDTTAIVLGFLAACAAIYCIFFWYRYLRI